VFPSKNSTNRHCGSNAPATTVDFITHTIRAKIVRFRSVAFALMISIEKFGYALDSPGVYFTDDVYRKTDFVTTA